MIDILGYIDVSLIQNRYRATVLKIDRELLRAIGDVILSKHQAELFDN